MLTDYAFIAIFALLGFCFGLLGVAFSLPRFFRRKGRESTDSAAERPVEAGAPTDNKTWVQFRLRYAVVSLVFIAFDMEMVYMFPWGVVFKRLGLVAFGDMFVFIVILAVAILFAWKNGAFDWEE